MNHGESIDAGKEKPVDASNQAHLNNDRLPRQETSIPLVFRDKKLQDFQLEAMREFQHGLDVIVAAPTGSGKTLIADWAIAEILKTGRGAIYASPVKALSNQKYRDYSASDHLGYRNVGLITGDAVINSDARLQVMTTEILHNRILENPKSLKYVDLVVFDELHYMDDDYRGTIWEESIMFAPRDLRMIALSASLPNIDAVLSWMEQLGRKVHVARQVKRSVKLEHRFWLPSYDALKDQEHTSLESTDDDEKEAKLRQFCAMSAKDVPKRWLAGNKMARRLREGSARSKFEEVKIAHVLIVDSLQEQQQFPAIYFCTARDECEEFANLHTARNLLDVNERETILKRFDELVEHFKVKFFSTTKDLRELIANGIAFHHAGVLPSLKLIVEELFTKRLIKLLFATETFAVGVNMPAKSVCLHYLAKYDGGGFRLLKGREYSQMAGRAGRLNLDNAGFVHSILHRQEVTREDLLGFESATVENISSHFDPSYRSLLRIAFNLNFTIDEAWQRSFACFEAPNTKSKPKRLDSLHGKWRFLERLRYIAATDEKQYTPLLKGEICRGVHGNEVQITEVFDRGFLRQCSPVQVAALFAAISSTKKVTTVIGKKSHVLDSTLQSDFTEWMNVLLDVENQENIEGTFKPPDFGICPLVQAWAEGGSISDVMDLVKGTEFKAGDFVGCLRITVQSIKSLFLTLTDLEKLGHVPSELIGVRPALKEAAARLWRDEADAMQHASWVG